MPSILTSVSPVTNFRTIQDNLPFFEWHHQLSFGFNAENEALFLGCTFVPSGRYSEKLELTIGDAVFRFNDPRPHIIVKFSAYYTKYATVPM